MKDLLEEWGDSVGEKMSDGDMERIKDRLIEKEREEAERGGRVAQNRGLDMPERLFWEAFVVRQDISRKEGSGYETGRASEPAFQDYNLHATRDYGKGHGPHAVVLQHDAANPLNPSGELQLYSNTYTYTS